MPFLLAVRVSIYGHGKDLGAILVGVLSGVAVVVAGGRLPSLSTISSVVALYRRVDLGIGLSGRITDGSTGHRDTV